MPKPTHIFAVFAIILLVAAALQPAIASPVNTLQNTNSTPEPSYVTEATASALASLVQMRNTANQHRRGVGIDVEALINATPGPEINFSKAWGSAGNAPGQFIEPWDAAFDSKGNIYVVDTRNDRIQKFYSNGTFVAQWGSAGAGEGQFNLPRSIALCPTADNNTDLVFVADTGNHRIQKFYSNGTFVAQWGTEGEGDAQFKNPTGIATDVAGNVFVADTENHRIQKFNASGGFITKWGSKGAGNGTFNRPSGIAVDSFSIDSTGTVFVADTANYRIQKFNSSGGFITKWGSEGAAEAEFQFPKGVAIDSSGNVYVADTENHRIQKFNSSGGFITKWGSEGTVNGTFNAPTGIAVAADGLVYVPDTENNRVQKFLQRDNDADSIPNSVELVLGTDPNYYDTDRDMLNDSYEVRNTSIGTDPLKLDSNGDGLADYFEVMNVCLDVDGDGIPNAWDCDNDGDGVVDGIDKSPFTKSSTHDKFHFDIKTKGNATYIDFQVRPKNPEHLKLPFQSWDWPYDDKGQIKDLDNSKDDVQITPMLELTANQVPNQSAVKDYGIVITEHKVAFKAWNGKYVCADKNLGEEVPLAANRDERGGWETFELIDRGNNTVAFKACSNGKYVCADKNLGEEVPLAANRDAIGGWETFELIDRGNNTVAFKACSNGKYVCADKNLGEEAPLAANRDAIDGCETFELIDLGGKAYVPLTPAQDYGTPAAFNARMFFPASDNPLNLSADAKLVWMVNAKTDNYTWHQIINKHSGMCMDVADWSTTDGGNIHQWEWKGQDNQKWRFEPVGDGYYKIINKHSGMCMDVADWSTTDGGNIHQWEWKGQDNQKWRFEPVGDGYYKIINKHSGMCMDVADWSTTDGGNIHQWEWKGQDNQKWKLKPDLEPEVMTKTVTIARYKEDFMLTGFSVTENYGTDAGLFYSADDRNQTMNAYLALRYEFLRSQNTLEEAPAKLTEHNVSVTSNISSYSHQDAALIAVLNKTKEVLDSLPDGKVLPIVFALSDVTADSAMGEFVSGSSYILGDDYDVDLTNKSEVTGKSIKMSWYNTTTDELITFDKLIEEVKTWDGDDEKKANMLMLLLIASFGEITLPKVDEYEIEFEEPEGSMVLEWIHKGYSVFEHLVGPLVMRIGNVPETLFLRTRSAIEGRLYAELSEMDILEIDAFEEHLKTAGKVEATKNMGELEAEAGEMVEEAGVTSKLDVFCKVLGIIGIIIVIGVAIYTFIAIANAEEWSAFGIVLGIVHVILQLIYVGILIAIACIPVAGEIIDIVIIIADIIATLFGHGSGWLMNKLISLFIQVKLRVKLDLKPGETTVNIEDYDDNGLTAGDKLGIKSWFWATASETYRGKHHGNHHDYRKSYIHPEYEYKKHDSTFDSGSYDHYCDSSEDHHHTKTEKCYTGLWITPKKGMINLPLTSWLSADYKFYYDECCCWICSGKHKKGTTNTDHDTSYFDVLPNDIKDFVRWHAISLRDNDSDGLLNDEEKGTGENYYKICAEHSGKCLDVSGVSTANGANVHQWEWRGGDNQKWKLEPVGDGYHKICAKHSGKCLDVSGGGTADGANVQQWEYGGGDNQKWNLEHVGDGNYKIINNNSRKCLDVSENSTANGANVWQWTWLNKGNQKWKLIPVESDTSANHWDTDADGLSDMFEVLSEVDYGTSPRIADTDADGLTDMLEFELGTLPNEKDTDADGLTDFEEHRGWRINFTYRGSGPVFNESVWSNPLFNDSDMDGLNDSEEYRIGFNARSSDTNGDGISDYDEVHGKSAGASPKVESSTSTRGTDGDGLTDETETTGWDISFTNSTGTHTIHVTSEPLLPDTDFDGLNDFEEYNRGSNPRALDTDGDGLNDFVENELGTNITHYDTDGDGLDDGTEVTFGSDAKQNDTDADGLSDFEEFELGSDPNNPDTDSDGLTDSQEKQFNTSLLLPDSDADLLFDNEEYNLSTDPWNPDTDGDNLTDGYEIVYNTNATNNDTDADSIPDGDEIDLWTNPLCNDTDSDGLFDSKELELGTNPIIADTNGDGINDSEDPDTHIPQVERVVLAYDTGINFVDELKQHTNVTVVTAEELLLNYSDAQYIVLVGRPDGNGTVGNVTRDILNDSGDVTMQTEMLESDYDRVAVEYGVWTPTQTVVMLSQPYKYDYCIVLSILKGMQVTRLPDSVEVEYLSARDFFSVEMVKEVDSSVWVDLEEAVTPWVKMSMYNASTTPFALTHAAGLAEDEEAAGRYFEINVSENVQNETGGIINWAWVGMYYTASDLDRNGDGDANDSGDINESTLRLYYFDESANRWIILSTDLDWVFDTGVNTTDDDQYGTEYEGFVWANVSHLCLFGLGGKTAAPIITSFDPPSPVKDIVGKWRSFNVTVDQTVNVSWYLNDSHLFTYEKVTEANYWLLAEVVGEHNVSAIATNANGTDIQTWVWNVETESPCYIATATYGTPLDENINVLRDFRDDVLMTNPIGEAFVSSYYTTSPPIADALRENDGLRAATRLTLITPLVYFSRFMLNGFWFVLLMLLGLAAAAVLLLREDKKKFLKSLFVGAGATLVFITAIFSLGLVGYTVPFCAVIGAYLLPFVIPLSVVFTLCTYYKNSWVHKQTTRFHKIYTRLKIRE